MPVGSERIAYVEGQMNELSLRLSGVEGSILRLEQAVNTRFDAVDRQCEALRRRTDVRFDTLDDKIARQFLWLVGIQITTLVAVVGAVLSRA